MVNAADLNSASVRIVGSSPTLSTMKFEIIEPPPLPPPPKHYVLTLSADELEYIRRAIMRYDDDEARERFLVEKDLVDEIKEAPDDSARA